MTIIRAIFLLLLTFSLSLSLAACSTQKPAQPEVPDQLISSSYAGIDHLLQTMQGKLEPNLPILVTTLANEKSLDGTSSFGRLVAEHIASRLTNAGYVVEDTSD